MFEGKEQGVLGPEPTDQALLARLARGDSSALGPLYDRYGGLSYGLAFHMLRDTTAASDVVQEAFVAVWRQARSFDPDRGSVRAWLLTTVRNRCIDFLRGPGRRVDVATLDDAPALVGGEDVWEVVSSHIEAETVRQALSDLPEEQRTTVQLAFFGGLTHTQIAVQMQVPLGTVKGRMRLAMEKLRATLVATRGVERAT